MRAALALALVLGLALFSFGPSIGFGFVDWDDQLYLTQNPLVVGPGSAPLRDHLLTPALGYPIPVTVATYRLEHALFGAESASVYHATNVVLHLLAVALLFGIGRRLRLSLTATALASVVFGLHPAVAEAVSWVTGRKDLLATAATLGAIWFALDGSSASGDTRPARTRALVASAALCMMAVLSKPTGACAPFVAAAVLILRSSGRTGLVLALRVYAAPVLLTLALFPIAYLNHSAMHGHRSAHGLGLLREAWYALGYHLGIVLMVRPNAAKYLPTPWPPPFDPWVDLLPFLVLGLALLGYRSLEISERRVAKVGGLLAVLAYLPSSSLIPLTRALADAYVHLSLAGLGLFLASIADTGARRLPLLRPALPIFAGTLAVGLCLPARVSSQRFFDDFALWSDNYELFPHDYRLCRNAANGAYWRFGAAAGLDAYRACSARHGPAAFERNIALALFELGRLDEAVPILQKILARDPTDAAVRKCLDAVHPRSVAAPLGRDAAPPNEPSP